MRLDEEMAAYVGLDWGDQQHAPRRPETVAARKLQLMCDEEIWCAERRVGV